MKRTFESGALARTLAVLAAVVFVVSTAAVGNSASAAPALDLVQVGLQPSLSLPYQYTVTAYNSSGNQVASYQSAYPGVALQLPTGTYLVTASAYYQNSTLCYQCAAGAALGSSASPGTAAIIRPYGGQYAEYGYSLTRVNGPASISIDLKNASALPLTQLTIRVAYANGTAASGAYVSGYVVGSYYVYTPKTTSYGQTEGGGTVTLTMPQAPVDVSAYLSIPIALAKNTSTVTVDVGGEQVNVTVYLQPSYLSLSGESLMLPPQTSADIVLHYQPSNYPIAYAGAPGVAAQGGAVSSGAALPGTAGQSSAQATTSASQTQLATKIAPFGASGSQLTTTSPMSTSSQGVAVSSIVVVEVVAVGGAVVVAIAASALFMRRNRSRAPPD